jgi:hypothetical protein
MLNIRKIAIFFCFSENFQQILADYGNSSRDGKPDNLVIYLTFTSNLISIISFTILTVIFSINKQMRAHVSGQCWLMFSIVSLFHYVTSFLGYCRAMGMDNEALRMVLGFFIYQHFFLEFSAYFWLCAICFETFLMVR